MTQHEDDAYEAIATLKNALRDLIESELQLHSDAAWYAEVRSHE